MKRILCLIICCMLLASPAQCKTATETLAERYAEAELLLIEKDYIGAASAFDALMTHSDASLMAVYCRAMDAAENDASFRDAIEAFTLLGDFRDSGLQAEYYAARELEAQAAAAEALGTETGLTGAIKTYTEAAKAYNAILLFRDSSSRNADCADKAAAINNTLMQRIYGDNNISSDPDILNATVTSFELPSELGGPDDFCVFSISDSLVLIADRYISSEGPFIYNLHTGEKCFLQPREKDSEKWNNLLESIVKRSNSTEMAESILKAVKDPMKECFAFAKKSNLPMYKNGRYLYWSSEHFRVVINMLDGETRPVDYPAIGIDENGNIITWNRASSSFETYTEDNVCVNAQRIDLNEEYESVCFQQNKSGFFGILRDVSLSFDKPMEYLAVKADSSGNVVSCVSLGLFRVLQGPDRIYVGSDGNHAVYSGNTHAPLFVRFDTGEVSVIDSDGTKLYLADPSEYLDDEGYFNSWNGQPQPMGISNGNQYMLLCDFVYGGMAAMDLGTLESRYILTAPEMEALSMSPFDLSTKLWNGESYLCSVNNRWLKLEFSK